MRLTFLSHEFPPIGGGASTALDFFTRALAKRGHTIQILTIGVGRKTETFTDEYARQIVRMGVKRKSLLAPQSGELLRSYVALRFGAKKYVEGFAPDAINAFFAFPAGRAALALGRKLKRPVVVSLRGSDVPGFSQKRWGLLHAIHPMLVRKVWREADLMLANGDHLVALAKRFYPSRDVINLSNGVDCASFCPEPEASSDTCLSILFVGQLIKRKRCIEMLQGIKWAAENGLQAHVTIVGDGPLRSAIEAFSRKMPSSVDISLVGVCDRATLPAMYRKHHVLMQLSEAEGVSNVLLEAMASGLAVVAVDAAFNRRKDTPALLIPNRDEETVGHILLELANNRERLRATGNACRKHAESYGWNQVAQQYEYMVGSSV